MRIGDTQPQVKELGERLGTDSPIETSEGVCPCQHLDLEFGLPEL